MAKKNTFFCKECGYESVGYLGKCPSCGVWNSFVEAPEASTSTSVKKNSKRQALWNSEAETVVLSEASFVDYTRLGTGINELDYILGGGLTCGSVVLVGGEPGIGKSTLLLEVANTLQTDKKILYISGEESASQIGGRARRLGITNDRILICTKTNLEDIVREVESHEPILCIVDSIQTIYTESASGTAGSVTQAREVTASLVQLAKTKNLSIILVGHITKDGAIAGPKTLEHMVDTVLYFEGDNVGDYRILRSVKNRFGRSGEIAFFEMTSSGLLPIVDASCALIEGRPIGAPGSALTSVLEGSRAIAIEIQALLTPTAFSNPQRMSTGVDRNRMSMLFAICEKHLKLELSSMDSFINVIGGLKISDPACDLAIVAAVLSSARGISIKPDTLVLGEVGLTGEIRPVSQVNQRLISAIASGVKTIILPSSNKKGVESDKNDNNLQKKFVSNEQIVNECDKIETIDKIYVDNIAEAIDMLFA